MRSVQPANLRGRFRHGAVTGIRSAHSKSSDRCFAAPCYLFVMSTRPDAETDRRTIAALDTAYQAAVERNDAITMGEILHDDMILVVGVGSVYTRKDILRSAREEDCIYERQVEDEGTQVVRMFGLDTGVITARLWLKGTRKDGSAFDRRLWFSDTYVRTTHGWKYAFGQASMDLPPAATPTQS
jgi:ketosteroid isomerase-like protein